MVCEAQVRSAWPLICGDQLSAEDFKALALPRRLVGPGGCGEGHLKLYEGEVLVVEMPGEPLSCRSYRGGHLEVNKAQSVDKSGSQVQSLAAFLKAQIKTSTSTSSYIC